METPAQKNILSTEFHIGGVSLTQKALLAKHLAVMLRSGLTITEALSIAGESTFGKMRSALVGVLASIEKGRSLSESFAQYPRVFPSLFIQTIYAGESSGTLSENLETIAEQLEKEKELTEKIQGAMVYPAVILTAAFILGMCMAFFILPKITPLFEGLRIQLPPTTRALIGFSHFIEIWGWWLFGGIAGAVVILTWFVRQPMSHPVTHWLVLHLPIVKRVSYGANIARFCRTLGTLLKSGVNIDEAIGITRNSQGNYYYASALHHISARVRKGGKLSESLDEYPHLFPIIVTRMVRVGEESGRFEETLFYLANFYEAEVDTATKSLSTAIEPLLLIIIGVLVGGLALSIITPIYEITGNIRR